MDKLNIYTDGAWSRVRNRGAFGIYVPGHRHQEVWPVHSTTNNAMELMAFIKALQYVQDHPQERFTVVTDSTYCALGYSSYMHGWAACNTIENRPNGELWRMVYDLWPTIPTSMGLRHCRGHGKGEDDLPEDVEGNHVIDKLVAACSREC